METKGAVRAVVGIVGGGALLYGLEVHMWGEDIPLWVYLAFSASCGVLFWWLGPGPDQRRKRKRQPAPQWYEALAAELEPLAKNLDTERAADAPPHVHGENRLGLQRVARKLDEHGIERPGNLNPSRGDTALWAAFLRSVALQIEAGKPERLATTYRDMRAAEEKRDAVHERFTRGLLGRLENDSENG